MYTFLGLGSIFRELITFDLRQLYLKKRKIGLARDNMEAGSEGVN